MDGLPPGEYYLGWYEESSDEEDVEASYMPDILAGVHDAGAGEGAEPQPHFMPDIMVNVIQAGEDKAIGIIREASVELCKVSLGTRGKGYTITALPSELEVVPPSKRDERVKIIGGQFLGYLGRVIGIVGESCIVKIDDQIRILPMAIVAKFVHP